MSVWTQLPHTAHIVTGVTLTTSIKILCAFLSIYFCVRILLDLLFHLSVSLLHLISPVLSWKVELRPCPGRLDVPAKSVHKWQEETRSQGPWIPGAARSGALSQSEPRHEGGGPMRRQQTSVLGTPRQIIPQFLTQTRSTLIHPIIPDGKNKWFHKR